MIGKKTTKLNACLTKINFNCKNYTKFKQIVFLNIFCEQISSCSRLGTDKITPEINLGPYLAS